MEEAVAMLIKARAFGHSPGDENVVYPKGSQGFVLREP